MSRVNTQLGDYVYIYNAARAQEKLVRDREDQERFVKMLHYLNDETAPRNWERDITREHVHQGYERPNHWADAQPFVSLLSFKVSDRDFALVVRAEQERGVERYMQKIGTSIAAYYNTKYRHEGSIFEGPYRATKIYKRTHLHYLAVAIEVQEVDRDLCYAAHSPRFDPVFEEIASLILNGKYKMDDELIDILLDTSY